jgi:Fe-S cluster assembly protein SufD
VAVLTNATALSAEAVEALSASRNEPVWMRDKRRAAWQLSQELPMPADTDEAWRRTDLRGLDLDQYAAVLPPTEAVSHREQLPAYLAPHLAMPETTVGGVLVHQDGNTLWQTLDSELVRQGVIFCDLDTAVQQHPELVEAHFMTEAVPVSSDAFTAMHGALWQGGAFLYVPKGVQVQVPLQALTAHATAAGMLQPHLLLIADSQSDVTFVDEQISEPADLQGFHNGVVELYLKRGARMTFVQIQNWSRRLWGISHQRAVLDADSQLHWATAGLGSRLYWTAQEVWLRAPGSNSRLFGLTFADGRQHLDYQTRQDHSAPHTESDLLFKGVGLDRARSVFRGVLHLRKEAQQTNAYQATHNLLLSPRARADALPILEIEADDVRCKHGSTTGRVDDEQIFYLMSRGLSRQDAQRLIVQGFFETVITEFPVEGAREKIRLAIEDRI